MKKINSEIKFNDNNFKVKIGTTDKKAPSTFYLELGTYITPTENKTSYAEDMISFEKDIKTHIKDKLSASDISKDFIMVVDVADERISVNKKSYMEIQLFIRSGNTHNLVFKELSNNFHKDYVVDLIEHVKNDLNELGYSYSKSKK